MAQNPLQVVEDVFDPGLNDEPAFMDTNTFMKTYVLELEKEWEVDGKTPEWAPVTDGGPLEWGKEHRSMELVDNDRDEAFLHDDQMAVSPDGKLIAISTEKVIRVYGMADKELRGELVGHLGSVSSMFFAPRVPEEQQDAQYLLLSQGAGDHGAYKQEDDTIIIWHLDHEGKSLTITTPFEVGSLADRAITTISQDLSNQHNLSTEAIADLRKGFLDALKTADTKNRQSSLLSFKGSFGSFNSNPVSPDGTLILALTSNESTPSGTRPAELLPKIVVRSILNPKIDPVAIMQGHIDAIMWASFSPTDSSIIASAAWDGTYRMWNTSTSPPTTLHTIKPKNKVQNWSGAFSPYSEYILLSGTDNVAIYSVSTGEKLHSLSSCEEFKVASWTRTISWNPVSNSIALASGSQILLWEPFDTESPNKCSAVVTHPSSGKDKRECMLDIFREFQAVKWLDEDVLVAKAAENSWLLWDRAKGLKWRFQRPKGTEGELYSDGCALLKGEDGKRVFVSLDADRKVREWAMD
ncbi:hypothetical protein M409DRAFT_51753 [Zasmidium cellare ATCC 36951]|uniref:Uncharacterized protein n=1 Tax=Zasmidium cellare ATCC 36951 TaxID=1080233 RepID=A0A6A6CSA2_ZASCE|nr:uncharacterized protein M409DRAFT_51753 [Zasmidium cellare ATCC 36951]KAF2169971.1 hypothetical protein M409DRAFT_51753 [Zasmidium cellare ATCC 36951]